MTPDIDEVALAILTSLLSNPVRYEYIADKVKNRELTNDEATQKNIDESFKIATQFIVAAKQKCLEIIWNTIYQNAISNNSKIDSKLVKHSLSAF